MEHEEEEHEAPVQMSVTDTAASLGDLGFLFLMALVLVGRLWRRLRQVPAHVGEIEVLGRRVLLGRKGSVPRLAPACTQSERVVSLLRRQEDGVAVIFVQRVEIRNRAGVVDLYGE